MNTSLSDYFITIHDIKVLSGSFVWWNHNFMHQITARATFTNLSCQEFWVVKIYLCFIVTWIHLVCVVGKAYDAAAEQWEITKACYWINWFSSYSTQICKLIVIIWIIHDFVCANTSIYLLNVWSASIIIQDTMLLRPDKSLEVLLLLIH